LQGDGSLPLSIQRTIFNLCVPLVLGFLAAVFWLLWCDLNPNPIPNPDHTLILTLILTLTHAFPAGYEPHGLRRQAVCVRTF